MNKIFTYITSIIILSFLIIVIITFHGCEGNKDINVTKILMQLPEDGRVILVPSQFAGFDTEKFNLKYINEVALIQKKAGYKYNEDEFYEVARSLGAQYIIISSNMTNNNLQFPWMTNKNFRVCPGTIDHESDVYYTLLVWDNSKKSYHFFKFLYE